MKQWQLYRQEEAEGFVAGRLVAAFAARQALLFGNSFVQILGKSSRVLNPWDTHTNMERS